MDDLALEGCHGCELLPLAAREHPPRHFVAHRGEFLAAAAAPARDVEHQPAALPRLLMNRQTRQFLQGVQYLATTADQLRQVLSTVDAHHRAVPLDVEIDVPVEIQEVEELLEVVAGDLTLGD